MRVSGPRVTLRGFLEEESDVLWRDQVRGHSERSGLQESSLRAELRERLRARVAASGSWGPTELMLAVEADGDLTGVIQARRSEDILPPGVFEIGIQIFSEHRGKGVGTESLWLLTDHLFREEGAIRVQLGTELDNEPMRKAAEAVGYSFEGVMRSFWPVPEGPPRDHALYGMTSLDHEGARPPWTRTS